MSHIDTALRRAASGREADRGTPTPAQGGGTAAAVLVGPQDYQTEAALDAPPARPEPVEIPYPAEAPEAQPPAPVAAIVEPVTAAAADAAPRAAVPPPVRARQRAVLPRPKEDALFIEQYRRLAGTLLQLQEERGLRTVMVTSALPSEGKTSACVNLALTLSRSYRRRVLLIDGDLRRPSLHQIFGVSQSRGLSQELVASGAPLPILEVADRLCVLPAAHPDANPTAILASDYMRHALARAATRFDWVLLDSPPVGLIADASLMARLVDGVVVVVAAGRTPYALAQKAIDDIGRDRIVGAVLNRAEPEAFGSTTYYYGYGGPSAQ